VIAPNDMRVPAVGVADPAATSSTHLLTGTGRERGTEHEGTPASGAYSPAANAASDVPPEERAHARLLLNALLVSARPLTIEESGRVAKEIVEDAGVLLRRAWALELREAVAFPRVPGAAGLHRPGSSS
jgi:hypothetical protein